MAGKALNRNRGPQVPGHSTLWMVTRPHTLPAFFSSHLAVSLLSKRYVNKDTQLLLMDSRL